MSERAWNEFASIGLADLAHVHAVTAITPAYLTCADYPWLRALLDERERFVGQRRREWRTRLLAPLAAGVPAGKLRVALGVLDRVAQDRIVHAVAPRKLRAVVFRQARHEPRRSRALELAAAQLGLIPQEVMDGLFCDLPDERALAALPTHVTPDGLAVLCNEAIVFSLFHKALRVRVTARGQVRAVVRHAKLMGLLCRAMPGASGDEVTLELSGPFALFRHTRMYGRALASLVPRLARCQAYRLEADCVLDAEGQIGRLTLRSGDPIAPARELPSFDSQVEERFARTFEKLARDWDLVREPRAIAVGDALIFPDFELRNRSTGESWLLEIVGFWTPQYVKHKLAMLKQARIERMIVCLDDDRSCAEGELETLGHVIRYRRRVDALAVIAVVDPVLFASLSSAPGVKERPARRRPSKIGARSTSSARSDAD
jgi:predicted nuclease of restriction endonuclease-like RecB superfamily